MNAQNNKPAPSKNEPTMTSLEIAEISGVKHDNLLKSIRKQEVAWLKVTGVNFNVSEYKDASGKKNPMYRLNQKECLYVGTKFNDEARARLIIEYEALKTQKQQKDLFGKTQKGYPALPPKRKHNRLTPTRINDLMADVVQIEDSHLRLSITKKLGL